MFSLSVFSQELQLSFNHLTLENGLIDNQINSFVSKDSYGFVWIGSSNGVYRFDGNNTKHYAIPDSEKFGKNVQSRFFEDRDKNLWFTTEHGLHHYDRLKDSIKSLQLTLNSDILKTDYHAFSYHKESNSLWLRIDNFLLTFDLAERKVKLIGKNSQSYRFLLKLSSTGEPEKIFGFPWRIFKGIEIWKKDIDNVWRMEYINTDILGNSNISNGVLDKDSILWLMSDKGLIEFNHQNKQVSNLFTPGKEEVRIWSGVQFDQNHLLLSIDNKGLWSFDINSKSFKKNWKHVEEDNKTLSSNRPFDLYKDRTGVIWVTQPSIGLDFTFDPLPIFNPLEQFNDNLKVKNIIEDNNGRIWVLTLEKGIFVFNLNKKFLFHFDEIQGHRDFSFAHLSIDRDGRIWLIMDGKSIFHYQDKSIVLQRDNWNIIYQGEEDLYSIFHGLSKTKVISPSGVFDLDSKQNITVLLPTPFFNDHSNGFKFKHFYSPQENICFIPYKEDTLWILDYEKELDAFKNKKTLSLNVFNVVQSKDSTTIWMASDKGLFRFIGNQVDTLLTYKELGKDCSIYSLVEDDKNILWFTNDVGLWSFNPQSKILLRYKTTNKLNGQLFNQGPGLLASNGTIWMDEANGLSVFNPKTIEIPPTSSEVFIENILVNNEIYDETSNHEIKELYLNHFQNNLEFDIGSVSINKFENLKIEYQLSNSDQKWHELGIDKKIRFPKLSSGNHMLKLRTNNHHNQKGKVKKLGISIALPFWETMWFRILSLLAALVIASLVAMFYFRNKLRHQERLLKQQKAINEERNRIAKELHDDMGGGLSSVLFISEDMLLDSNIENEQVERISQLTQEALINMKDIIWALDTDQSTLHDLMVKIKTYASQFLFDHQIGFELESALETEKEIFIGSEKKRNILLIVKECLHNVIKHANATNVKMDFRKKNEGLFFSIQDNGKGFDLLLHQKTGNGLENIQFRSNEVSGKIDIQSTINIGTTINFVIPL